MADASSWNSTIPSGSSEIRKGDDLLRSHWSILEATLEEEHFFAADNSGASAGIHRPGSSRISYGNGPAPTTSDEGRLFYDVDDDQLVVQGSSATTPVGAGVTGNIAGQFRLSGDSIGASDGGIIHWDEEVYDADGMHGGSNPHVSLNAGGKYVLNAQVRFAEAISDNVRVEIQPGAGGILLGGQSAAQSVWSTDRVNVTWIGEVGSDNTYVVSINGLGGSNRTIDASGTYLSVHKLATS